jgi:hypothetical protein
MAQPKTITGLLAALALLLLGPVSAGAAGSPQETVTAILAAARAQQSVHYVTDARFGTFHTRMVCDVGRTRGIQRITFQSEGKTGTVTVLVVAGSAYLRGDSFVLTRYMGFKAAGSAGYAGKWVRIPRTDRHYAAVAEAVTLSSAIGELRLAGPLSALPETTIAGRRVLGIKGATTGKPKVPEALYARAQGLPLPVGEIASDGTAVVVTNLSGWNEAVHVAVPPHAAAIATTGLE